MCVCGLHAVYVKFDYKIYLKKQIKYPYACQDASAESGMTVQLKVCVVLPLNVLIGL